MSYIHRNTYIQVISKATYNKACGLMNLFMYSNRYNQAVDLRILNIVSQNNTLNESSL